MVNGELHDFRARHITSRCIWGRLRLRGRKAYTGCQQDEASSSDRFERHRCQDYDPGSSGRGWHGRRSGHHSGSHTSHDGKREWLCRNSAKCFPSFRIQDGSLSFCCASLKSEARKSCHSSPSSSGSNSALRRGGNATSIFAPIEFYLPMAPGAGPNGTAEAAGDLVATSKETLLVLSAERAPMMDTACGTAAFPTTAFQALSAGSGRRAGQLVKRTPLPPPSRMR